MKIEFYIAVKKGHIRKVKQFVKDGCDPFELNSTAMRLACMCGRARVVQYLISLGQDIHMNQEEFLRCAVDEGHLGVVKVLIKAGADVTVLDNVCLRHSVLNGDDLILAELLKAGADKTANNYEALFFICRDGNVPCAKLLLNLELPQEQVESLVVVAAHNQRVEIVRLLMSLYPNTKVTNEYLIKLLSFREDKEILELLNLI